MTPHPPPSVAAARRLRESPILPERLLAKLWRAKAGATLRTTDGRRVRVLYPGRPAPGHGPDFRDAVLELDGQPLNGPVELHRIPSDWAAHGHQNDRAYDNVVLHVVAASPETPRTRQHSRVSAMTTIAPQPTTDDQRVPRLPTVVLSDKPSAKRRAPRRTAAGSGLLLRDLAALDDTKLRARLRTAGMARFDERVADAASAIDARGIDQALMNAIMDGLGYAENRAGFAELARLVPVAVLQATARSAPAATRTGLIADLLIGGSGLENPTPAWVQFIGIPPMDPTAWRTSGVRPSNHPRRRIAALARYVANAERGLAAWLRPHALEGPRDLVATLRVESNADSGADSGKGPALLGESRAIEIAINAVLPILVADAQRRGDTQAATRLHLTYDRCNAPPPNTIVREALGLLRHRGRLALRACEQQGLMRCYQRAVAPAVAAASS